MDNYTIIKTGCFSEFGCCDELQPYNSCDDNCIYGDKGDCPQWIKKGSSIKKGDLTTHCGSEDLFVIIDRNLQECITNKIVAEQIRQ